MAGRFLNRDSQDILSRRSIRYSIKQLVLSFCKEHLRSLIRCVIIATQRKQISNLLVKTLFRGADVTNPLKKFIEIIGPAIWILEALIINIKTLHQELF